MSLILSLRLIKFVIAIFLNIGIWTTLFIQNGQAFVKERHVVYIKGIVVNGANRILDGPARDYGTVLGIPIDTISFSELAVYNPDGDEPLPLTSETPKSAVLATNFDAEFAQIFGIDPSTIDSSLSNVPLQQVKTLVSGDNITRESLPGISESVPFSLSISAPNKPITLGDWQKASGMAIINCNDDGSSKVKLTFKNMIPNRIYSVWAAVVTPQGVANPPFGGVPPAFVTNDKGNAVFKRELNFCPLELNEEVNGQIMWIAVVLHSDHMLYGGVFSTDKLFAGTVSHDHMAFPLLGEPTQ